jgi:hypothetical protein
VSSIPGANSLFEGQQIKEQGQIKRGETEIEERHRDKDTDRRETPKRNRRRIKDSDQGRSKQQI